MRLTLRDDGYPFKKIMNGRKWIGRVVLHAEGGYLGIIGQCSVRRPTESEAFQEVAAQFMGFGTADALRQSNAVVRQRNRARRANARHALEEIMRGNFKPLDELFKRSDK